MKKAIIIFIVIILVGVGIYFFTKTSSNTVNNIDGNQNATTTQTGNNGQTGAIEQDKSKTIIGTSAGGNAITAYHFGNGTTTELLFVGGIHGGYEWNTALVAFQLMDYLKASPSAIPVNVQVTVIPVLNPDGLSKVVGTTTRFSAADVSSSQEVQVSGRFNGNTVDLNRNFDCDWQTTGTWQNKSVSGGTAAFSEPESKAIRDYIQAHSPAAVVVWYSAAGGVFASNCHNGVSAKTRALMKTYADASGYRGYDNFDFYAITGDMTNWLAKINIPTISVLLTNHTDTEWSKNQAGIKALLASYAK